MEKVDRFSRMKRSRAPLRRTAGFTLIEVMVVVVIIGVLATLVLPRVVGRQDEAYVNKAKADIRALSSALTLYKLDNFVYPDSDSLDALVQNVSNARNWKGYIDVLPKDPWGHPYQYVYPGQNMPHSFDLWTLGADGQHGGESFAADIGNWNMYD